MFILVGGGSRGGAVTPSAMALSGAQGVAWIYVSITVGRCRRGARPARGSGDHTSWGWRSIMNALSRNTARVEGNRRRGEASRDARLGRAYRRSGRGHQLPIELLEARRLFAAFVVTSAANA